MILDGYEISDIYDNYHKHTHESNIRTLDCVVKPEDYMKRAAELGHTTYFTTEHGWQGNIFNAYTLAEQYGLKLVYGVEAYYCDDMYDHSSRTAYHIILIALTDNARKEINKILSKANTDGFYYKPRIDMECLLSLTPEETIITTACVASRMFKTEDWETAFLQPLVKHFGKNLFLEVQNHNVAIQKEYNQLILKVKEKYGLPLIHANDSHYIKPEDSKYRDLFLQAKGIFYEEETNFILDYPDTKTIVERYQKQGVLSSEQIAEAINNTLLLEKAEPIKLDKEFKIPNIDENIIKKALHNSQFDCSDADMVLREFIKRAWSREKGKVKASRIPEYEKAIYYEMDIIKRCGMAKYFILDHIIVDKAIKEHNAVLTRSGRGSAVSFYVNHLLGLTEVDRLKSPITLYPTRFMSAERILNSRSLPDIDLNFANVEPVIEASKEILGEDGIYYMVAFKPLQESSAFRLWCKAKHYNIEEYDEVAKNLDDYVEDNKWKDVIEESKIFRGVIESIAPSPCSFLLLDKPISEEVGLIKVGDVITCAIDGYSCDCYKYLKNDYLVVSVYDIIDKVYKLLGRPIDDIATLVNNCDEKVWDIYAKGLTTTINQCDSDFGKQTLKRYKPQSLAEMSAWVAAIRPGFASLLNTFLDREPYSTGVAELDDLLEDSFHFLMYQESIMKFLVWLGMEEKGTYDIIKKISKKKFKEAELIALKEQLQEGWLRNVGTEDGFNETWQVVEDAAHYSFNASHSLSVAIDSMYGAYLKSHYPLEYFTVALCMYSGDMLRTANLISELPYFNIKLETIVFGKSGADYTMNKETNTIYKGISSVKYCNSKMADELMEVYNKKKYNNFIELLDEISKTSVNTRQLSILIGLNFFKEFGENKYLIDILGYYNGIKEDKKTVFPALKNKKTFKKDDIDKYTEYGLTEYIISKYAGKETEKQYSQIDNVGLMLELCSKLENKPLPIIEQIKFEKEYLEYVNYTNPVVQPCYYIITEFQTFKDASKPTITARRICDGTEIKTKIKRGKIFKAAPFGLYSVLQIDGFTTEFKKKYVNGEWVTSDETEEILEYYDVIK